ncbi:MAG TPA: diguanylate cyclase [Burkholderiales bacterium]|nr:diguanylate cyclase [Burkholderiales bacterium]
MNAPLNPTDIARETLRELATRRIAPTPDNYRELYHRIAGHAAGDEYEEDLIAKLGRFSEHLVKGAQHGEAAATMEKALAKRDWKVLSAVLLALSSEESNGKAGHAPDRHAPKEWARTLRSLVQAFEVNHAGWTRARKREAFETLLNSSPRDTDALLSRLRGLITSWEETPPVAAGVEAADAAARPGEESPESIVQQLRDCLFCALDLALPSLLRHAPDLAWEARTLAGRVRQADSVEALVQLGNDLQLFSRRAELHGGGDGQVREALLRLLRLIVDNIRELVEGDHWIQGQVAIVKNVLDRTLTPEVIEEAERAIKDLMVRQGALKRSLDEARASLKALLQDFIERLGGMSDETSNYQSKLESYSGRLQQTDSIAAMNDIVRDLLRDTRSMYEATEQSRKALTTARQHVQAAEVRIQQMERELENLTERAREDQLTGALNRRGLDEAFKRESARADRQSSTMCVALLDIDNFKKLNDTLGHKAGDEALLHIVQVVQEHLRPGDSLARYGGEEFVILLPDSDVEVAVDVMSRLQRELTKRFFLHNNEKLLITFSCGVSQRAAGEELEPAVSRADRALYEAKRKGKNRVVAAGHA